MTSSASPTGAIANGRNADWDPDETMDVAIWSWLEPALALTAISLAVLRPLFVSLMRDRTEPSFQSPTKYQDLERSGPMSPNIRSKFEEESKGRQVAMHNFSPDRPSTHTVVIEGGLKKQALTRLTKEPPVPKESLVTTKEPPGSFFEEHDSSPVESFDESKLRMSSQTFDSKKKVRMI